MSSQYRPDQADLPFSRPILLFRIGFSISVFFHMQLYTHPIL